MSDAGERLSVDWYSIIGRVQHIFDTQNLRASTSSFSANSIVGGWLIYIMHVCILLYFVVGWVRGVDLAVEVVGCGEDVL